MKKTFTFLALLTSFIISAQLNPAITNWLVNTTNITGRHYVSGNSTPITDAVLANVQTVQYNTNYVYVTATGIPAYITGPFLDGNPSLATAQNKIFRITLTPTQNTGTLTATTGGNIGIFKNGVALFDYRDGVSYKNSTGAEAGGPIGGTGDGVWNRDAIVAERGGFDCSKAHPAQGNYHHHQNPSAFNLDLQVLSTICDTYPSDGLYVINPSQHSPLLGYAYDGFPIYGAYAYANTDGTGGIVRMKSSYQLRNITARTHYADGTDVTDGPPVNTTYPLGRYREDYEFVTNSSPDYLDKHNGRFCITPEYPSGIYCYFTTVDANHNSAYPYAVGPYFYGVKNTTTGGTVTSIPGGTTTLSSDSFENNNFDITIAPNPASEFIAIQSKMTESDLDVELISELGQVIKKSKILQGSTLSIIETDSVYNGIY
ncbi:YHYH protein, partial [Flavobacterium sp. LMO9]